MRIALLHNEAAGSGVALSQIRDAIERHGHEIVRVVDNERDAKHLLDDRAELVVAAGGDGTVAVAAEVLARQDTPLAVLPLGTANNIASMLKLEGDLDQLIARWAVGRRMPFDLGLCRGSWGESRFLESVGCGLIAAGMSTMKAQAADVNERPASRVARAARNYREALSTMNANRQTVILDGRRLEDDFLLVEVLNTPAIGPNLRLSSITDPSDGMLTVVMAREADRPELTTLLDLQLEGAREYPSLPATCVSVVEIVGPTLIHVDGEIQTQPGPVSIRLEAAALEFLV